MGKSIDLLGQKFGRLTVIEKSKQLYHGSVMWICKCDCGNIVEIPSSSLIHNRTKSCGCISKEKIKDITGKRFGRLIAVEPTKKRQQGGIVWKCKCDCGNIAYASYSNLMQGHSKSCGCFLKEKATESGMKKAKDIAGIRFGKLVAIEPTQKRMAGFIIWKCKCDCGNITFVNSNSLLTGNTTSCGCYIHESKKIKESALKNINNFRKENYIDNTRLDFLDKTNPNKNNSTGHRGVYFRKDTGKYFSKIMFRSTNYNLGTFNTIEEAISARKDAEENIFKPFLHKKKISKETYEIIKFKVAISASEVIRVYKLVLNGTIDRFPHCFWEDIKENELKLLLRYFFEVVLKWKDEDFYKYYNIDIFKKYKLLGMAEIIFKSNTAKILDFVYPKRFKKSVNK